MLLAVAIQGDSFASVTRLHIDDKETLRKVSSFHDIHTASNLPQGVFDLCADNEGRLAEPGRRWEATDYITNSKLPRNRLVWAVTNGDYYVVHYESGGWGHNFNVLVARLKPTAIKPNVVWQGLGGKLKSFGAFLDAVASSKQDDIFKYAH